MNNISIVKTSIDIQYSHPLFVTFQMTQYMHVSCRFCCPLGVRTLILCTVVSVILNVCVPWRGGPGLLFDVILTKRMQILANNCNIFFFAPERLIWVAKSEMSIFLTINWFWQFTFYEIYLDRYSKECFCFHVTCFCIYFLLMLPNFQNNSSLIFTWNMIRI